MPKGRGSGVWRWTHPTQVWSPTNQTLFKTAPRDDTRLMGNWFESGFKAQVTLAVRALEKQSSAEVVVVVHRRSTNSRAVDLGVGLCAALLTLCVFLYHPASFDFTFLPLELGAAVLTGSVLSAATPLGRWLVRPKVFDRAVDRAASAAFTDCGVYRTRKATGLLVFISVYERRARVLADEGVSNATLDMLRAAVQRAAAANRPEDLVTALADCAPTLIAELPRSADDENELPDDVTEAA